MNTAPNNTPRPPLCQFILTSDQLASLVLSKPSRRRPVWRHHYDPYAGAPVSQTVEEALARVAKAPPGTIPEVEMLTDEEIERRMEEIRNRPDPAPSRSKPTRRKR